MKQYTFFILGRIKHQGPLFTESTAIIVTLPSDSLLSEATLKALEQFKKGVASASSEYVLVDQLSLIGVQHVIKYESGEYKAVS